MIKFQEGDRKIIKAEKLSKRGEALIDSYGNHSAYINADGMVWQVLLSAQKKLKKMLFSYKRGSYSIARPGDFFIKGKNRVTFIESVKQIIPTFVEIDECWKVIAVDGNEITLEWAPKAIRKEDFPQYMRFGMTHKSANGLYWGESNKIEFGDSQKEVERPINFLTEEAPLGQVDKRWVSIKNGIATFFMEFNDLIFTGRFIPKDISSLKTQVYLRKYTNDFCPFPDGVRMDQYWKVVCDKPEILTEALQNLVSMELKEGLTELEREDVQFLRLDKDMFKIG